MRSKTNGSKEAVKGSSDDMIYVWDIFSSPHTYRRNLGSLFTKPSTKGANQRKPSEIKRNAAQ